jgi:hypothetical protein
MTKRPEPTLPLFETSHVSASVVRITRAGDGLSEALKVSPHALQLGETVHYILAGTCTQVAHTDKDGTVTRVHTIAADRITEVDADLADKMLTAAEENLAAARAEADNQLSLAAEASAVERERND